MPDNVPKPNFRLGAEEVPGQDEKPEIENGVLLVNKTDKASRGHGQGNKPQYIICTTPLMD